MCLWGVQTYKLLSADHYNFHNIKIYPYFRNGGMGGVYCKHISGPIRTKMKSQKDEVMQILLVEDNPGDIRLTQEALKEGSIKNVLNVVKDGVEALDYLKKKGKFMNNPTPDIILLDLNLPRKDGREVLAEIKSDEYLKLIPVIILTTSDADQDILRSYKLHANCFITKPVDLDQFIFIIRQIETFWFTVVKLPIKKY